LRHWKTHKPTTHIRPLVTFKGLLAGFWVTAGINYHINNTKAFKGKLNTMENGDLTQSELKELHNAGKVMLFAYRTIFEIKFNENTESFGLCKIVKKPSGEPYTKRGRFVALDSEDAFKLINS